MAEERPADFPKLDNYTPSRFMLPTSHYDKSKADRAMAFIENLRHTKGKWAGKRFWLLPWQEQIVRDIFGIIKEDGTRQFHTAYVEIGKKNGKQLALDTPIPTPNGFTPMGESCEWEIPYLMKTGIRAALWQRARLTIRSRHIN